jgi:hypothetical protein
MNRIVAATRRGNRPGSGESRRSIERWPRPGVVSFYLGYVRKMFTISFTPPDGKPQRR